MYTGEIFQLEGDTGEVAQHAFWSWAAHTSPLDWPPSSAGHGMYGGAVDGRDNLWIFDGESQLGRVSLDTLEVDSFDVPCGYGIAVDARGRAWTSGGGCVNRFDPGSGEHVTFNSVWVADTSGRLLRFDEELVELTDEIELGASDVVGVAVDYHGKVWAVSQGDDAALRLDPESGAVERFPVGAGPYTYSDMTGFQLRTVIPY